MNKTFAVGAVSGAVLLVLVVIVAELVPQLRTAHSQPAAVAVAVVPRPSTSATPTGQQIACARTAIDVRENAIDAANTRFESSMNAAYAARAAAIDKAYTQTSWTTVASAEQSAANVFNASATRAQAVLKAADVSAGNTYTAAIAACKAKYPA